MFGQFIANTVQFFIKKPLVYLGVFGGVLAFLIVGLNRLKIEEDLYAVFPDGKEYQEFSNILQRNNLNKQLVFSVKVLDDETQTLDDLDTLVSKLKQRFGKELADFDVYKTVDEQTLIHYLQSAAIVRLKQEDYLRFNQKITKDSIRKAIADCEQRMNGSNGFFLRNFLAIDPLGLVNKQLSLANPLSDKSDYIVKDGLIFTKDEQKILFFATLQLDLKDTKALSRFNKDLGQFKDKWNSKAKADVDYFGTFQIAAENADQVKSDTSITLFISLGLILLVLIFYYRSVLAPLYFILPAIFGMLCGGGMVGYLHPEISAISLATSSVLLGIVLDYSFHFFTHFKHSKNLLETVREISAPMVIGSFTTVAALAALMFTDSVVLQNFGLIALCTLTGSVLFTLIFLPVIIHFLRIKLPEGRGSTKKQVANKIFVRVSFAVIAVVTFIFLFNDLSFQFDADLNNLSFHSPELKKKEAAFTGINPEKQKKIYIITKAASLEEAKSINAKVYETALNNKESFQIKELVSTAPYLLPQSQVAAANQRWTSFWKDKKARVSMEIASAANDHNFSATAFEPFTKWMDAGNIDVQTGSELCAEMGLNKFQYSDKAGVSFITSVVLDRSQLVNCKAAFNQIDGVFVLDIADITAKMLNSVQTDFNYLLVFSSLLVFLSLLVVYGRIELAIFAFFPMVLGWVWILGISNLMDLKFNFVNIVIATFIFGLGDDFSIFITDGLIQRYKTGTDIIKSYRSAIILSGITTIIGTGALYFAKHPAIHSIALISVVGIACILFITLFIQPSIFNLLAINRVKKGKVPITFFTMIYSLLLFTYFFIGSILLNLFLILVLMPFPAPKVKKRALLNYLVSKLAKSTLYAGFHVKKRIIHPELLDFSKPSILVANHTSFLDILLVIMLHPKAIIIVKSWVYNSPVFGLFIRYAGYPFSQDGAEMNLEIIQKRIEDGYSIVVFPEGTRSKDGEIKRFHKGAFFLAKELNLAIQPLLLIGAHEVNPKNDILISKGHLNVLVMDRVTSPPEESFSQYTKRVQAMMREAYDLGRKEFAKTSFWQTELIKNYVLKGPVLEWYVRIKWMLERKNFEFYDELIGDRTSIMDIGCGYGYLSYYLHYRNPKRTIKALDYDQEKILVAANGRKKSEGLSFEAADIRAVDFEPMDVVFLNDVLHYLPKTDQDIVLEQIAASMNDNGILFIRDGLKELEERFKKTKFTEFLSTKLFKFNKTTNELSFLSRSDMEVFALKHGFSLEIIEHSKMTSNVLLILRKETNGNAV